MGPFIITGVGNAVILSGDAFFLVTLREGQLTFDTKV